MAVPVFGPIALDEVPDSEAPAVATALAAAAAPSRAPARSTRPNPATGAEREPGHSSAPVKLLIITGDHGHDWKATTQSLKEILSPGGKIEVDVTTTPAKDLTDANLAKYDVLLLNYKDTPGGPPETKWSDANKAAFLKAVHDGKGLVVFHFASSAFTRPNWVEFEKAIAGGWRNQGFHGPEARIHREEDRGQAPDLRWAARPVRAHDRRALPELGDGAWQRRPGDGLFRPEQTRRAPARTNRSSG